MLARVARLQPHIQKSFSPLARSFCAVEPKSENIVWDKGLVSREQREKTLGQRGGTVWLTGLSGSGKSAIATSLEVELVKRGAAVYRLDGDNLRFGLNSDLGFSAEDRDENIRRVGEVARLLADAGLIVLTAFISPYNAGRDRAAERHSGSGLPFLEVHVDCSVEVAESRDPKGLYQLAREGKITDFTGISAPYEAPVNPALRLDSGSQTLEESVADLIAKLEDDGLIPALPQAAAAAPAAADAAPAAAAADAAAVAVPSTAGHPEYPHLPSPVTPMPVHGKSGSSSDGGLVNLLPGSQAEKEEWAAAARADATHVIQLDQRQACDVELIINGGFSPLTGFMGQQQYSGVVADSRLPDCGTLFPMPVTLPTADPSIVPGSKLLLQYTNFEGETQDIAAMTVEETYTPDKALHASAVFGTSSLEHPGVASLAAAGPTFLGGPLTGLELPKRPMPCQTPAEVRAGLPDGRRVAAFQCRNPVHRAHYELFASIQTRIPDAMVLVHPTCGPTQSGDIDADIRFQTYTALQQELAATPGAAEVAWAYLPYSMHLAGPREALMHMILRKNYGATHFIVGRDMAGTKSTLTGDDFYGAFDAQEAAIGAAEELGMGVVPFRMMVYTEEAGFVTAEQAKEQGLSSLTLSGTEFRRKLRAREPIPRWFSFKSVVDVLQQEVAANPST